MPKVTLTRETLVALKPCDLPDRLRKFGGADAMGVREAFDAGFTVADVLWVAGRLGLAQDCARVALFAAKQVAHFNPDPRVAAALEAAQRCICAPTPAAADAAAHAAADVPAHADAAAHAAAHAAHAAARAAATAARAAANAANAAANAADAAAPLRALAIELWG